jgi:hypothetical protein
MGKFWCLICLWGDIGITRSKAVAKAALFWCSWAEPIDGSLQLTQTRFSLFFFFFLHI